MEADSNSRHKREGLSAKYRLRAWDEVNHVW
jgi:hypothetical protein